MSRVLDRPWSLVTRLTVWYAASSFFLVLISTMFLYWSLMKTLNAQSDFLLLEKAQAAASLKDDESLKRRVETEWPARQNDRVMLRILDASDHILTQSPRVQTVPFDDIVHGLAVFDLDSRVKHGFEIGFSDGSRYRALVVHVGSRVIELALSRDNEEAFLSQYRRQLGLVLAFSLFLCAFVGRRIAIRGIRPVADIAETASRIRSTTLHERINIEDLPAELYALASTFNEMLDRLSESFGRLSQFSADIAHELRTPLNNLRFEIEVILGKKRSVEEYSDTLGSCLEETVRISRIIDSLLFLARAENPQTQLAKERIDLKNELEAVKEFYEASAQEGGIRLTVTAPGNIFLNVEKTLFHRAIANLVGNAISHTKSGGKIEIQAKQEDGTLRVTVSDTGTGIPNEHIPYLFDRFYRVDQARTSKAGRVGLGLSIVKSIAHIHGGNVSIDSEVGRGTNVTVTFPLA